MSLIKAGIRRASVADASVLSDLGIRSKAVWGYSEEMMATFRDELTLSRRYIEENFVYALWMDVVLGYYSLVPHEPDAVELGHLFVEPGQFGCGHGARLYRHAVERARAAGYEKMVIQSDPNAAGFYEKLGATLVRQVPSSVPGRTIPVFEAHM